MRNNFLQRSHQKPSFLPSIHQRTQQSQVFLTSLSLKQKQSIPLPQIPIINPSTSTSPESDLLQSKQYYQILVQRTNQLKNTVSTLKSQYRQINRKIKHTKIHIQSEINKIQAVVDIDFKYLKKNWQYVGTVGGPFVDSQILGEEKELEDVGVLVRMLVDKVGRIQEEIG